MKDPKGRKNVGFDKHVFVCENKNKPTFLQVYLSGQT